jgi:hypothetical protein
MGYRIHVNNKYYFIVANYLKYIEIFLINHYEDISKKYNGNIPNYI